MSELGVDVASLARSAASVPFWEGLQERRLVLPWCRACKTPFFYPRRWCPTCHGDALDWREAAGTGTVWAHSTVVTPFHPDVPVPYVALLVDLDEGVRMAGMLEDASVQVAVGDRIELVWRDPASSTLPVWRPQ